MENKIYHRDTEARRRPFYRCHPEEGAKPSEGPYVAVHYPCSRKDNPCRTHRDALPSTSSAQHAHIRSLTSASPPLSMTSRFAVLHPNLLPHDFQNLLMRLPGCSPRIHHDYPPWLSLGDRRESLPHPPKERPRLAFEAILVMPARRVLRVALIPSPRAIHARVWIRIQQNRQLRLQIAAQHPMQLSNRRAPQFPSASLIGLGRIGKTIAQHDAPGSEPRL